MKYALLQPAVDAVLQSINAVAYLQTGQAGNPNNATAYEAFLLACLIDAVQTNGWAVRLIPTRSAFIVPGNQCSFVRFGSVYSVVEFDSPSRTYWALTACCGQAYAKGGEMEADILVVDASKVAGWQGAGTQPPFPELYVLIEAKDHTAGVGRMEGKSFIGICQQLRRQPCVEAFVSSTSISPNAITVLNNNGSPFGRLECYERVSPLPADTAHRAFFVRDLATRMAARL